MSKTGKYIYRTLETRDGEREYTHKSIHQFDEPLSENEVNEFLEDLVQTFWGENNTGKESEGAYWFFGEIITSIGVWEFITEEEFNVLKRFI